MRRTRLLFASLLIVLGSSGVAAWAQDAPPAQGQQSSSDAGGHRGRRAEGQGEALLGRITAISSGTLEIIRPDGTSATVKLTDKTAFRKDRQPAKQSDFKVGDGVMVRGEQGSDKSWTAAMVAGRTETGEGGGRGPGGGRAVFGEIGKDFVAGEVKSVDAPKLTVLRTDNVTQTLELNEETSLHKGRESITMADIQPGDHVIARGALENNVFVPKNLMLLTPEQWQRMQEMGMGRGGNGAAAPGSAPPVKGEAPKPSPQQLQR